MKKTLLTTGLLLCAVFSFAGNKAKSGNKIKMITYFPVPYVAYSKINIDQQMDIGLTNTCSMNLGCEESGAAGLKPLQALTVNLNRGRLDLYKGAAVESRQVILGEGIGMAEINFKKNLRIGTLWKGYSMETGQMIVDVLKMFPSRVKNDFPSCAATGANGAPQVSWKQIKLKKNPETYLVCGTPKEAEKCRPTHHGQESYAEECPAGHSGSIQYTWDYSLCAYTKQDSCHKKWKKCLTKRIYCAGASISIGAINHGECGGETEKPPVRNCDDYKNSRSGMLNAYAWNWTFLSALTEQGYLEADRLSCKPGTECDSCELNGRYISPRSPLYGINCRDTRYIYGPGSCRALLVFGFSACELKEDCAEGIEQICDSWGGTFEDFMLYS